MLYEIKNTFDSPDYYKYSEFKGVEYLQDYFKSRQAVYDSLYLKINKPIDNKLFFITDYSLGNSDYDMDTLFMLDQLQYQLLNKKDIKEIQKFLDIFVKKYEVFRKIFDRYTSSYRKIGDEFRNYRIYIDLSFCLLSYYEMTNNLKFLNCALKINDMTCSIHEQLSKPVDIVCFLRTIKLETEFILKLIKNKKITCYDTQRPWYVNFFNKTHKLIY